MGGSSLLKHDTYKAGSYLMQISSKSCWLGTGFRDHHECQSRLIAAVCGFRVAIRMCCVYKVPTTGLESSPTALGFYVFYHIRYSNCPRK